MQNSAVQNNALRVAPAVLVIAVASTLSGCEVVEGIFKAGVWVGVIVVALIVAAAGAIVAFVRNRVSGPKRT